jgi:hypothetical protein
VQANADDKLRGGRAVSPFALKVASAAWLPERFIIRNQIWNCSPLALPIFTQPLECMLLIMVRYARYRA